MLHAMMTSPTQAGGHGAFEGALVRAFERAQGAVLDDATEAEQASLREVRGFTVSAANSLFNAADACPSSARCYEVIPSHRMSRRLNWRRPLRYIRFSRSQPW
jgi:hypothetical protein